MSVSANGKSVQRVSGDLKIFIKDVGDHQQSRKKRPITIKTWSTVKDVKDVLQQHLHVPASCQRLFFHPSLGELPNHRTLQDAGIYRNGDTLLLEMTSHHNSAHSSSLNLTSLKKGAVVDICVSSSMLDLTDRGGRSLVQQSRRGLALGLKPALVLDGSGGSYFLRNARQMNVAVFKPADEEPYAENNPRGYVGSKGNGGGCSVGESMRAGIQPGEACLREVAAYLLDHKNFSGVPMTTLVEARHPAFNHDGSMMKLSEGGASLGHHALSSITTTSNTSASIGVQQQKVVAPKVGSFQAFVKAECSMDDLSPSKLSVEEVHKIAILDIRIMNADRNSANLLVRRKPDNTLELVPIDHGYCLRTVVDVCWFDWCWLDWPQLKEPLSQAHRDYILQTIDIEADIRLLQERIHIPSDALDYFRATNRLLKTGVKAGMTLYDIAVICCRNDDCGELPSKLENMMAMAKELASAAVRNGRWHHTAASRALADQLRAEVVTNNTPSFSKSKSSAALLVTTSSDTSTCTEDHGDNEDNDEEEECDEWAAAVVAEARVVETNNASSPYHSSSHQRQRAISYGNYDEHNDNHNNDDSSKSTDGGGFWHVAPNDDDKSDDSSSWAPSLGVSPKLSPTQNIRASVTFDVPTILLPPIASMLPPIEVPAISSTTFGLGKKKGGLQRSLSYSAFSTFRSEEEKKSSSICSNDDVIDDDQYRLYLIKYVDLLIKSETMSHMTRCRQDSVTSEISVSDDIFFSQESQQQ
jgi:hypothetical protein